MKNFGVKYPSQNKEVYEKQKQHILEKYGIDNILKRQDVIDNNKNKWKDDSFRKIIIEKRARTNLLNKGFLKEDLDNSLYSCLEIRRNHFRLDTYERRKNYVKKFGFELVSSFEYYKDNKTSPKKGITLEYKHTDCGKTFKQYTCSGFIYGEGFLICPYCPSTYIGSREQSQVVEFIQSIYNKELKQNDRKTLPNYEIDIFLPDKKLAIEYNGTIWHTEHFAEKSKYYHFDKWNQAKDKGIDLIYIYDFEWKNKQEIVKSLLRNRLGICFNKIYARNTTVKEVDYSFAKEYYNNNHIQGSGICNSKMIHLALFYKEEAVSLMSFDPNSIRNKKYEYELTRFSNKINNVVVGGFSKLVSYFESQFNPTSIITYSEIRLFNSEVYSKNGFNLKYETKPGYFYTLHGKFYGYRQSFKKSDVQQLFNNYDNSLTVFQNLVNNGFDRVWDCGVRVFIKEY